MLRIFDPQAISHNSFTQNWTITNSFRAAYVSWDQANNSSQSPLKTEREFDYGEFPLEQFYNLILETNQEFETEIKQSTTIGIEVNKNPFLLSGEGINSTSTPQTSSAAMLPSPYITEDFISKKNYLGLFIEHEITLSDRLSLNFEGTLDVVIGDNTDLPELPSVEPVENNNFFPELSLDYELTDNIFLFTTVNYSAELIEGTDINDRPFDSETYRGIELGIETELNDNWLATLSFYHEAQNNITTTDPNEPDFELQINQQSNNSWTGEIRGEVTPGWWLYGFYTYTDATVTEDEAIAIGSSVAGVARHSGALWTSYEIPQGVWQGLGFGSGISWNGSRSGDAENSSTLPSYLQTDAAIFYAQDDFRAAVSIQNLFNAGVKDDEEITARSLFGTVWLQF
jgi:outer membrane receptor for ferric coprogen and ferric-rhodotorulic acid